MLRRPTVTLILAIALGAAPAAARADETPQSLHYQNGHFEPSNLAVRANAPFKVQVANFDSAPIEFESFELHRERVVRPGETITVFIPALAPGNYEFFDDFHHDAPKGVIVAK
jgi:Cupredoxin-like domain